MKRKLIDGRWRGRITTYPGRVLFWYECKKRGLTIIGVCMFCDRDIYAHLGECEKGCGL